MTTPVGTSLNGRYRLDAQVGSGGMSTVYRAFDVVLERPVAVKVMHRDLSGHADQLERFRREARAVAQLNHPYIVQVIDAGEDDDPAHPTPFIVFEYVEGETLKERIRRLTRLPVDEAIAYAIEIAHGLGAAHERGIVHRDVKPQNVLVDEEGSAKVTDFGIARTLEQDGLTADGRVLGTTDYVSPEQALGHIVTGQSDLYSLGVVLFEMLTGDVPFHGDSQVAVAMKHVREEVPDVLVRRPGVSSALAAVVDRTTAKDLSVRYASAAELIADLEEVLMIEASRSGQATGEATTILRALPERRRDRLPLRMRTPMAVVVALLVAGAIAVAAILVLAAGRAERGTGAGRDAPPAAAGTEVVSLGQKAATDFDPQGTGGEHGGETPFVLDREPSTFWSTETYQDGNLGLKDGVGLYVDARPSAAGRAIDIETGTPGFTAAIYGASSGPPEELADWAQLSEPVKVGPSERIELDTDQSYRFYLVWITAFREGDERAEISELRLLAEG